VTAAATPRDEPADEDLDALSWAGDEDRESRGVRTARGERARAASAAAARAEGEGAAAAEPLPVASETAAARPARSPAESALTALGAVLYLVLTVGWILAVQVTGAGSTEIVEQVLWQLGEFLAIAAAPLWFFAVQTLAPAGRLGVRAGWLALGLGLLLPWPLLPTVLA